MLRFAALMHDIAKPLTRAVSDDGRIGFPGHDVRGAAMARAILARLHAAERVRAQVEALTRNHLRLGFLVHEAPLSRRALYGYLDACDRVAADVTVLSVADRLATRGERAEVAIARHLELAREVIGEALRWQRDGRPPRAGARRRARRARSGSSPARSSASCSRRSSRRPTPATIANAAQAIAFAAARIA